MLTLDEIFNKGQFFLTMHITAITQRYKIDRNYIEENINFHHQFLTRPLQVF